jgi:hypothetical protein
MRGAVYHGQFTQAGELYTVELRRSRSFLPWLVLREEIEHESSELPWEEVL